MGGLSGLLWNIVFMFGLLARFMICLSNVLRLGLFLVTTFILGLDCK